MDVINDSQEQQPACQWRQSQHLQQPYELSLYFSRDGDKTFCVSLSSSHKLVYYSIQQPSLLFRPTTEEHKSVIGQARRGLSQTTCTKAACTFAASGTNTHRTAHVFFHIITPTGR